MADSRAVWFTQTEAEPLVRGLEARVTEAEDPARSMAAAVYAALWNSSEDLEPSVKLSTSRWDSERWVRAMSSSAPTLVRNTLRAVLEPVLAKRSAIDSPRTVFMASSASYEQRLAAEQLTEFFFGFAAQAHGGYSDLAQMARSAVQCAVVCTGSVAAFAGWCHATQRVEVSWDDTLCLYVRRAGNRPDGRIVEVVRTYKREAACIEAEYSPGLDCDCDPTRLVTVVEGWLLASGSSPGRHTTVCRDGTDCYVLADDDEFAQKEPPCAILHVSPPIGGSQWALPMSHHIRTALALENEAINEWVKVFRSLPSLVVTYRGADLKDPRPLQDADAILAVELDDSAPREAGIEVQQVPRLAEDTMRYIETLRSGILDGVGVSEPMIRGDRTEGTRSGKHEAYVTQLTTERHAVLERDIIIWRTVALARVVVPELQRALAEHSSFSVLVTGDRKRSATRLALRDLDLSGADLYALRPAAVSEEVDSPRARREQIQARFDSGAITMSEYIEGLRHLDDTTGGESGEAIAEFWSGQYRQWLSAPEKRLGQLADELVPPMPELGVLALEDLQRRASRAYIQGLNDGLPGQRLELIHLFLSYTAAALAQARAALAPPPAPGAPA